MVVVPLISNRSYSELDTERYCTYVSWKDGQCVYAIGAPGAVKDIRRNLAYDSQLGEKRS